MLKVATSLIAGLVAMGGWAVVTVKDLPEYLVAGQQYTLEFQVRQHGREPLGDPHPRLVISTSERRLAGLISGKDELSVPAVARPGAGTYAVTFTAPAAERVFLTIKSGFGNSQLRLYPQRVIAAGASRPTVAGAERGQLLFVAKGCVTCHSNTDLAERPDNQTLTVGPELGGRRLTRDYVIQKLKSPSQNMPDLGLSEAEVTALAAFLTGERAAATGGSR
jgi:mono/diheme cytochrome c family protein